VLQWFVWHLRIAEGATLEAVLALALHIRNPAHYPDCNSMEALRVFDRIPEPQRTSFLAGHFADFASLVFPITTAFGCFMRAQFNLFIRVMRCASAELRVLFATDTFRAAFIAVLSLPSPPRARAPPARAVCRGPPRRDGMRVRP
jgi:hypothetical protein